MNTELRFTNRVGGSMHFVVGNVIGLGGSCIVYDGYYLNNTGSRSTVRIKECYPYKLHLTRNQSGALIIVNNEENKFNTYKDRIRKSFEVTNELHEETGLTNYTANVFDVYEANNTVYIVSSYIEGSTLLDIEFKSLKNAVRVVLSTAKCIQKIHDKGYLYLDIKPENILMYDETPELIQLFDFDSIIPIGISGDITEYKISYSLGFSPMEQRSGNMSQIGKYTDIYSIGALLFYLLFGKAPKATDCGFETEYDYSKLKCDNLFQPRVYKELTEFFHNTLQAYYKDRYQDISEVISKLCNIEKYADKSVAFICSENIINNGLIIGREKECGKLLNWYNSDEKLIFVTGMGGIGKSTIVRKFVSDNRDKFDNIIYLKFKESLCETIGDDLQFCIKGYNKEAEESSKDYFIRKISTARNLTVDTNTLLVIDNFNGAITEEFAKLLDVNWKIIAITRSDMSNSGFAIQKIQELKENGDLHLLFESNVGRKLKRDELVKVDDIAKIVKNHTLVLILIAKQIAKSYLDIDEALDIVQANGFSKMAPEKVDYMHDGIMLYEKVSVIIRAMYDVSVLSPDKKKCLKLCSLFDAPGISVKEVMQVLQPESLDNINELKDLGWIEVLDNCLQMHPLIQETIHQIEWTDEYRNVALEEIKNLLKIIKLNGNHNEYVVKPQDRNKLAKNNMTQQNLLTGLIHKMWHNREISTKITPDIIMNEDKQYTPDHKKLKQVLSMAKSVLQHCGEDNLIIKSNLYKDLMFFTLMNLPNDQEEYIINNADILFNDLEYKNSYNVIKLYDYIVFLLCQKKDYEAVKQYLNKAKLFADKCKDDYVWGIYYDMLGVFYDALLGGAYYSTENEEQQFVKQMLYADNLSIKHMGKSRHEKAKGLYTKFVIGKANLLIRSMPERQKEIKKLIQSTTDMVEKTTLNYSEVRTSYYLAWAWYYTLCEENKNAVLDNLKKASEANEKRNISDLDRIDYFFIPAANMMLELADIGKTVNWLEEAYNLCELHKGELPYIRKKLDLLSYEFDTYHCQGKYDNCKQVLGRVVAVNQEADEYNITLEVPKEILKALQ